MSDLKPWDVGYVAPVPINMSAKAKGDLGGEARKNGVRKPKKAPSRPPMSQETKERFESLTEDNISFKQKVFCDKFINEYLHDFNAPMAWIRAGGPVASATTGGYKTLKMQYTQNQLRIVRELMDEEHMVTRADVVFGIKQEANYHGLDGSSSARVRAWGLLAKIKGMEAPVKQELEVTHKGGVMVVPMVNNILDWEQQAAISQDALKLNVRK